MIAVSVSTSAGFVKGGSQRLFELPLEVGTTTVATGFAVTPDGQRFLGRTNEVKTSPPPDRIQIIFNWFEEVRAKAGR